jgi:hypothetical protein
MPVLTEVIVAGASAVSLTEPMPVASQVVTAAICPIAVLPMNAVASNKPRHMLRPADFRAPARTGVSLIIAPP